MNRNFLLICSAAIFTNFALTGCSKSTAPPAGTETGQKLLMSADRCGNTSATSLLQTIEAREALKEKLQADAKATPAKANFRKLFDFEIEFLKETEQALETLSRCENPVAPFVLDTLKKKILSSRTNLNYLAENFPDFKQSI